MYKFCLIALFVVPSLVFGECVDYRKIHGLINLKQKVWETTHVNKDPVKVCEGLPQPERVNLEVSIVKGKEKFKTTIYQSLVGHWDKIAEDEQWTGGKFELKHLSVESFVPTWYKGATLTITEIDSKKIIIETKL